MSRTAAVDIPPEPYHLGVVTDRDGRAWQRRDGLFVGAWGSDAYPVRWVPAQGPDREVSPLSWPALVAMLGPLEVHYEGDTAG